MKWISMLAGFMSFAMLGTLVSGWLMLVVWPSRSSYGDAVAMLLAPMAGIVLGLAGIPPGYFVHQREYATAGGVTVLLMLALAVIALYLYSAIA